MARPSKTAAGKPTRAPSLFSWQGSTKGAAGDLFCMLLLLAMGLWISLPRYSSGLDLGDEGLLAYGAVRVLDGDIPNRDFFTLHPPLSFYTVAAVFRIFGTSLLSLRLLGLALYLLIPLLIYAIARKLLGRPLSLLAALPSLVLGLPYPYYHFVPLPAWQGVVACLGAVLLLWQASASARFAGLLACAAGCFNGAALLLRQDQGLYVILATLTYAVGLAATKPYADNRPKALRLVAWWSAGGLLFLLPPTIYWLHAGAAPSMFRQLFLFLFTTYGKTSALPFPSLRSALTLGPTAVNLLYFLPPLVWIGAAIRLWRLRNRGGQPFNAMLKPLFLLIWSALFYLQVLVRTDMWHLLMTLPPFFILLAWCLDGLSTPVRHMLDARPPAVVWMIKGALVSFVMAVSLGCFLLLKPGFLLAPFDASEMLRLPRAGIRTGGSVNLAKFIQRIQATAPPERPILCLPYQPMFYFLAERRNPTRWNYLWPGDQTPQDLQNLIRQSEANPPALVVLTREPEMKAYAQEILDYVHRVYRLTGNAGDLFRVYERRDEIGKPAP